MTAHAAFLQDAGNVFRIRHLAMRRDLGHAADQAAVRFDHRSSDWLTGQ